MVGEGVLHECILNPQVESILLVNRKPSGIEHPKVEELILPDFFTLWHIEGHLYGYNACFFCLGVSSVGKTAIIINIPTILLLLLPVPWQN